jgi:TATA-binding protein-associated factor Taf7
MFVLSHELFHGLFNLFNCPRANAVAAMEYPLPPGVDVLDEKTLQYAHGLAPPLRWVRKRFRDVLSTNSNLGGKIECSS